jgi:hypothetical protein
MILEPSPAKSKSTMLLKMWTVDRGLLPQPGAAARGAKSNAVLKTKVPHTRRFSVRFSYDTTWLHPNLLILPPLDGQLHRCFIDGLRLCVVRMSYKKCRMCSITLLKMSLTHVVLMLIPSTSSAQQNTTQGLSLRVGD